jgi:hypothetical protein
MKEEGIFKCVGYRRINQDQHETTENIIDGAGKF